MAVVYLAHDIKHNRPVALKVLASELGTPRFTDRFFREITIAAKLSHPNILPLHDSGSADGRLFYVTPFVEGESLRAWLDRDGRLPLETALRLAVEIADALDYAHRHGIIHRDIKPANILIADGHAVVADFGIATVFAGDGSERLTQSGVVLGTPGYMSPEQSLGAGVDARSDTYSLACVLFEMLVGDVPRNAETAAKRLQSVRPAVPREVTGALVRALAVLPEERQQSTSEFKHALTAASAKPRHRWLLTLGAIGVLIIAAAVFWRTWTARAGAAALQAVPLTTSPGLERYPSFSPNGNQVAYTWTGPTQDNPDVYVQQIGAGEPLRLTNDPGNDYNPVWSPDDRWIAFLRARSDTGTVELRLIPPLGGPERKLADIRMRRGYVVVPPHLAWCPDSSCLIVTASPGPDAPDALFVIALETAQLRQLTYPKAPAAGDSNPALAPDGHVLVFRRNAAGLYNGELYRLALNADMTAAGEPVRITEATLDAGYPTFLPDGKQILFAAKAALWRMNLSNDRLAERLPFVGEDGLMPVVARRTQEGGARLVYVRNFVDANIWRIELPAVGAPTSAAPVSAIASTRSESMVQLSPDGQRAAFTSDRSGGWEIWVANPDGSNAIQLTSLGARASGYPHWSPDGREIVFHSNIDGQWEVYTVSASGGRARRLTNHPASDYTPAYSRDGRWIYFDSNRSGDFRIWKMPAPGGDPVEVTKDAAYAPSESPDGAYLYYLDSFLGPGSLWRQPVAGGAPAKLLDGVILANYVVLESGIYYFDKFSGPEGVPYMERRGENVRLRYFDFATRQSVTVAPNIGSIDLPMTANPDGRVIYFSRIDATVDDLMLVEGFR